MYQLQKICCLIMALIIQSYYYNMNESITVFAKDKFKDEQLSITSGYNILNEKIENEYNHECGKIARELQQVIAGLSEGYEPNLWKDKVNINLYYFDGIIPQKKNIFDKKNDDIQILIWLGENESSGWLISLTGQKKNVQIIYNEFIYQLNHYKRKYYSISDDLLEEHAKVSADVVISENATYEDISKKSYCNLQKNLQINNCITSDSDETISEMKANVKKYCFDYKHYLGTKESDNNWQLAFYLDIKNYDRTHIWLEEEISGLHNGEWSSLTESDINIEKKEEKKSSYNKVKYQISGETEDYSELKITIKGYYKEFWNEDNIWFLTLNGDIREQLGIFYDRAKNKWNDAKGTCFIIAEFTILKLQRHQKVAVNNIK